MAPGADLFIVCRHCGSEVSPYITECPYCGRRLRKRAPKLPRARGGSAGGGGEGGGGEGLGPARARTLLAGYRGRLRQRGAVVKASGTARPYVTIGLVLAAAGVWVATSSGLTSPLNLAMHGSLSGRWWRLFSSQFLYLSGVYAFVALLAIALFGWLMERRHGALVVLALFLGAGVSGALAAEAVYSHPLISGGGGAALGLLAAWAAPDLRAAQAHELYEGDLLGAAAFAVALLAMPFALGAQAGGSWLTVLVGGLFGLIVGFGIARMASIAEL